MFSADVAAFLALVDAGAAAAVARRRLQHWACHSAVRRPGREPAVSRLFNATPRVRKAFGRTVPLILDYCAASDIVHKNPYGSYRYIDDDHTMFCTARDFADAKTQRHGLNECNAYVAAPGWTLPPRSLSLDAYYAPYVPRKRSAPANLAGRLKHQAGGTGLESCAVSHFMGFVAGASEREDLTTRHRHELFYEKAFAEKVKLYVVSLLRAMRAMLRGWGGKA